MSRRKFRNGADKPVVALDIDGTLGDYHGHFLRFASGWVGKPMPPAKEINPGLPLYKHMRISRALYRDCKLAFRQGGLKRSMPAYDYAGELTSGIRRAGAEVWICTTRPYLRLDNIDPDTREWLKRNHIQYDAVIFGESKYRELVKQVGIHRVCAVADDLPEQVIKAYHAKLCPIFLMDQPYNKGWEDKGTQWYPGEVERIYDLEDLAASIHILLKEFE